MNIIIGLFLLFFSFNIFAESVITSDNTLGTRVSPTLEITGGQQRGENLFHSFEQFNLGKGDTAHFLNNDNNINNIISRVTGNELSKIAGTIKTDSPNFYFINPNGIILEDGAVLEVPGAVYFSTADYLMLRDGGRFDANLPQKDVLTVAPPEAFGFLDKPEAITMQRVIIRDKKEIGLVGGDITVEDSKLDTPNGSLLLVSVASPGEAKIATQPSDNAPKQFGNLTLSKSQLQANGRIYIRAGELHLIASNDTTAGISSNGTIIIEADNLTMAGGTTEVLTDTKAKGQIDLIIHQSLKMHDTAVIRTDIKDMKEEGLSGRISITADSIQLTDDATIDTSTYGATGTVNAGEIRVTAKSLSLSGEAWLLASSFNSGQGGTITVNVENLKLSDKSALAATTFRSGQGGDIRLTVDGQLSLANEAVVTAGTEGPGTGGKVVIHSPQINIADKASISSVSEVGKKQDTFVDTIKAVFDRANKGIPFTGGGQAGTIEITTDNLVVNGMITVYSGSDKIAGNINLRINGQLHLKNGEITTDAAGNDGGNINIESGGIINLQQRSKITASANAKEGGNGGNITIGQQVAPEFVVLNNSQVLAKAKGGDGGRIRIISGNFVQSMNSEVSADTESKKHVDGTVEIEAVKDELQGDFTGLRKDFLAVPTLKNCPKEAQEMSHFGVERRDGVSPIAGDLF